MINKKYIQDFCRGLNDVFIIIWWISLIIWIRRWFPLKFSQLRVTTWVMHFWRTNDDMIKRQKFYSYVYVSPQIFSDHFWLNNHFYPKTSIILFEMLATSSLFRYKIFSAVYLRKVFFLELCRFQGPLISSDMSQYQFICQIILAPLMQFRWKIFS